MFVYFVQAERGGPAKIGVATDPERRLAAIQVSSPFRMRILAVAPGARDEEAALHQELADDRLHGEWFQATPRADAMLRAFVAAHGGVLRRGMIVNGATTPRAARSKSRVPDKRGA